MRVLKKRIRLHRAQAEFCHSTALYRGFVGGRGSGKSWAISYDLIRRAKRGRLYLMASPTYTILADTDFRAFVGLAREMHCLGSVKHSPPSVRLTTGAEVIFRSADDPEKLRGPNLSGVALNEASLMDRDAYSISIACLREAGEQGWLTAAFTPKGKRHWTFEVFGGDCPLPDTAIFHARTKDNPFIPRTFQTTLSKQYAGSQIKQELEGEFIDVEGAEWPLSYFGPEIWFTDWPGSLICKTIALDPSKGREAKAGDYAAFAVLGVDEYGTLWVETHLSRSHTAEGLAEQMVDYSSSWHPDACAVETNQFQQLLATLISLSAARRGILVPTVPLDNRVPKIVRIRRIGPYLMAGRIRFRDTPGTRLAVDQLREFPEGKHDDGPDAIEMAIRVAADLLASSGRAEPETVVTT